jgi:S1-C subfamily serine protease
MENGRQFHVNVYGKKIGSTVKIVYSRNGKESSVDVGVIERPGDPFAFVDMSNPQQYLVKNLGILAITLDARIASVLPAVRYPAGAVVIASSGTDVTIWGDVFFPGDIIYSVNASRVTDLDQLRAEVANQKSGDAFVVQVERQGQLKYLAFEVE